LKTDFKTTNISEFFEECQKDARDMQVATCGSEIVGLIPLESILMAADYYIKKENILVLEESQKVKLVS
jgi:glutamate formiminotransferase / formiminotetrahydrofolate cyclodeaminase